MTKMCVIVVARKVWIDCVKSGGDLRRIRIFVVSIVVVPVLFLSRSPPEHQFPSYFISHSRANTSCVHARILIIHAHPHLTVGNVDVVKLQTQQCLHPQPFSAGQAEFRDRFTLDAENI